MYNFLLDYVEELQKKGKYTFSFNNVKNVFPGSLEALKLSLNRLKKKDKIVPVRKGFYVIVPAEYANMGIMPPILFINDLMKFLKKPYYVSLLSAAALYGAAHQQPMEFFVTNIPPSNRAVKTKGIKINFITKSKMPDFGIVEQKTDTGYVKVSCPELTAYDLIYFQNRIGGLNRVATILDELVEEINGKRLRQMVEQDFSTASLQRLGYFLEIVLDKSKLANSIYEGLHPKQMFRIPLRSGGEKKDWPVNDRWNVIVNEEVESEL